MSRQDDYGLWGGQGWIPDSIPFFGTREKLAGTQASVGVPVEERIKPYVPSTPADFAPAPAAPGGPPPEGPPSPPTSFPPPWLLPAGLAVGVVCVGWWLATRNRQGDL
jgi:hypothetical protein